MPNYVTLEKFRESFNCLPKNSIMLGELDEYLRDGDHLFIHQDSGVVTSDLKHSSKEILDYWSQKIFTSTDVEDYSAFRPFAKARLYYVVLTMLDYLKDQGLDQDLSFCDFATGQGVLPELLKKDAFLLIYSAHTMISVRTFKHDVQIFKCVISNKSE